MAKKIRARRKEKKNIPNGIVHIQSTFNNTIVTITDPAGNVIAWSSSGVQGFKGSRKSTPFAAQLAAEDAAKKAIKIGEDLVFKETWKGLFEDDSVMEQIKAIT